MKNITIKKLNFINYGPFYTLILNNRIFEPITRFFQWKIYNNTKGGMLAFSTQRLYTYDFYNFLKLLNKFDYSWDTITSQDIRKIRDYLDQKKEMDRNTINRKTYIWVEFYQWCRDNNIKVAVIPKYKKIKRKLNVDDNFLSHISLGNSHLVNEFYLSPLKSEKTYKVLTEDEFQKLKLQLRSKDIMYEAIATVMVTTGLRIDEVLQLQNITFPPSTVLSDEEPLEYFYVPKGQKSTGKKVSCMFPFETWDYLSKVVLKFRKKRLENNNSNHYNMFVDERGNKIKACRVQKAFREISEIDNNRKIVPHMLRHTYATWIVIQWAKENKINNISESFYKDIHEMLSEQLNHKNISTTKKYCKTAARYKFSKVLPIVNEKAHSKDYIKESLDYLIKEEYL